MLSGSGNDVKCKHFFRSIGILFSIDLPFQLTPLLTMYAKVVTNPTRRWPSASHIQIPVVAKGVDTLIHGAFGCGAFQNDLVIVAKAYKTVLQEYLKVFRKNEFVVYCPPGGSRNYDVFKRVLGQRCQIRIRANSYLWYYVTSRRPSVLRLMSMDGRTCLNWSPGWAKRIHWIWKILNGSWLKMKSNGTPSMLIRLWSGRIKGIPYQLMWSWSRWSRQSSFIILKAWFHILKTIWVHSVHWKNVKLVDFTRFPLAFCVSIYYNKHILKLGGSYATKSIWWN